MSSAPGSQMNLVGKRLKYLAAAFIIAQASIASCLVWRGFSGHGVMPLLLALAASVASALGIYVLQVSWRGLKYQQSQLESENRELVESCAEVAGILAAHEEKEQALTEALELAEIQKSMQEHASRRFQSLFEGLPLGASTFDEEGVVFEWNQQMSQLIGIEPHFAILNTISHGLRLEESPERVAEVIQKIFTEGEMVAFEHSFVKEGSPRIVDLRFFPLRNREGTVLGGIATGQDVTEERAAQKKIRDMAALQTAVLDSAEYSIVWADEDGLVIGMNSAAEEMLGYELSDSLEKRSLADFFLTAETDLRRAQIEAKTGTVLESAEELLRYSASRDELRESEWQYLRQDGRTVDVHLSLSEIRDDSDVVLGYLTIAKDISEKKALEERMQMLSMVAQESMNSVLILDASGHILYTNPAFTAMSGYEYEDVIGEQPFGFRCQGNEESETTSKLKQAIRSHSSARGEMQFVHSNGDCYWSRITISPVVNESGFCSHVVLIEDDVTGQKTAQMQVVESEARFRDVVESAGEYIWEVNTDFRFTFVSPKIQDVLGYTPEEIMGRSPLDFLAKEDVRPIQNKIAASQLDGAPVKNLLLRSTGKFGQVVWQRFNAIPVFYADGELRGFRGTGLDVTEQKLAEDALAAANVRVQRILDSINDSFYSLDNEGRFTYVNSSAASNGGVESWELLGVRIWEHHSDDYWAPVRELFNEVTKTGRSQTMEFLDQATGAWLEFRVYSNQDNGISVFYKDISDRKDTERQLAEQMSMLNEANVQLEIQQGLLQEANSKLQNLASTDGLTGLKNHKTFQEFLADKMANADIAELSIGVCLMDVDKFKLFNDGFGHLAGDEVLKRVAATLQACVQEPHLVARYGGEEFVIVGVGLDEDAMFDLAEDCRARIEDQDWIHRQVTASFGVAMLEPDITTRPELIDRADRALYAAKEAGRNRVLRWSDVPQDQRAA